MNDDISLAVLHSRVQHLEPRVEHIHKKGHETANMVIGLNLEVQDVRHAVKGCQSDVEALKAMTTSAAESTARLAGMADVDRERFLAMQSTMNSVLTSIRAVAIGSAIVVIGAALVQVFLK